MSRSFVGEVVAFQINNMIGSRTLSKGNHSKKLNKKEERSKNGRYQDDRWCSHCQKSGHAIDGCFELISYPDWWSTNTNTSKQHPNKSKELNLQTATVSGDMSK